MPCCNTAPYKRLQRVFRRPCNYTAHAAKQRTGLYKRFSCDLPHSTTYNTRPTQAAIIPPAPRWSVSQRPDALHRYQIPAPRRTLHRSAQPPYYNKVYKARRLLRIHARQCSISQTMPARRGQLLPCVDLWQVLHPAHLLKGQRFHLCRVSPAACSLAPVSGQGAPGQPGTFHPAGAVQQQRRSGAEPLTATAVSLFGLSPDSQ